MAAVPETIDDQMHALEVQFAARKPSEYALPKGYLSFSQVRNYLDCPACYEEQYIKGNPPRLSDALPIGSGVHQGVAHARRMLIAGQPITDVDVAEAALTGFRECWNGIRLDGTAPEVPPVIELKDYTSKDTAESAVMEFATRAAAPIIDRDRRVGVAFVEAQVDFSGVYPFTYTGRLDAMMADGTLDSLKTASRQDPPDYYASLQLRSEAMALWAAEDRFSLQLTQVVKRKPVIVRTFSHVVTDDQMRAARAQILTVAEAISQGCFPIRKSFTHNFDHAVPVFTVVA